MAADRRALPAHRGRGISRAGFLRLACSAAALAGVGALTGCVNQHPDGDKNASLDDKAKKHELRIVATSPAVVSICDKLALDLVGVSSSSLTPIPDRYKKVTQVGMAMSPDLEKVKKLNPDYVLSPNSLQGDLQPKYAGAHVRSIFLNLKSVDGMFYSIHQLGQKFYVEEAAEKLVGEFDSFMKKYNDGIKGKKRPRVLVLMGLPGSYIVATEHSYAGNIAKLAGGDNVYAEQTDEFVLMSTEDMLKRKPDVILRAAHAMPDVVKQMFDKDFKENQIWSHFDAVKNGRVYDLPYDYVGMSATFKYQQALEAVRPMLFGQTAGTDGTTTSAGA